ncbi:BLUF domain-containing protein [Arsukibacterium sp.]|uniref:BLUF domain-containing protein n=1 Tax=Arsukibacterium sp. TaxID=1977258 RepID=UPI00299EAF5A|nr:BLUF domain-containing protein [Arsukibacterium sp.]MDX1678900.1 BLUF domain-containing protein [Arsukibacterium sp.]
MALVRLIYTSKTNPAFAGNALEQILESSRVNNSKQFITGCLFFNKNFIIQYLEGGAVQVNQLYNRIVQDKRHTDIRLMDYAWIDKRLFAGWSMGFAADTTATRKIFVNYAETDSFNPLNLPVDAAIHLLRDLKDFAGAHQTGQS